MIAPAIILVRPQLGVNIGACARAMLNFGLTALRLVSPRDGWPNADAGPAASGADEVLETVGAWRGGTVRIRLGLSTGRRAGQRRGGHSFGGHSFGGSGARWSVR